MPKCETPNIPSRPRRFEFRAWLIRGCFGVSRIGFRVSARIFRSGTIAKTNRGGMSARSIGAEPKGGRAGSREAILSIKKIRRAPNPHRHPERARSDHDHGKRDRNFPLHRHWFARGGREVPEWISRARRRAWNRGGTWDLRAKRRRECNQYRKCADGRESLEMASHRIDHVCPAASSIVVAPVAV